MATFVRDVSGGWLNLDHVQSARPAGERDRYDNDLVVCSLQDGSEFRVRQIEWDGAQQRGAPRWVFPAREGYELLWMQDEGEPVSEPIIGWSVEPEGLVSPITVEEVESSEQTMIKRPDGVVVQALTKSYANVEEAMKDWARQKRQQDPPADT